MSLVLDLKLMWWPFKMDFVCGNTRHTVKTVAWYYSIEKWDF